MPQVFLSHSSQDNVHAQALRDHLLESGWSPEDVFLDISPEGLGKPTPTPTPRASPA